MERKIDEMRRAAQSLTAHLGEQEFALRQLEIDRLLSEYDFAIDVGDIAVNNPVHILLEYLQSFFGEDKTDEVEAEWFAVLALYLINHLEQHDNDEAYCHFIWHALNTAVVSDERAQIVEYRAHAHPAQP